MSDTEPKLGRLAYTDRKQRRHTRSLPLNEYEHEALKALAKQAGLSTGDYVTQKLRLPSNATEASKFAHRLAKSSPANPAPQA